MRLWVASAAVSCLLFMAGAAASQGYTSDQNQDSDVHTLHTVVVTAEQSGPALWEMSRGNKRIWILGTFQPLPKDLTWIPDKIKERINQSDIVLGPQGLIAGDNIGLLRALTLWPSIRRIKFNPDDKSLHDVLMPATYARWLDAKARYLDDDDNVERLKPMYAAFELYEAALKKAKLTSESLVNPVVVRAARKHSIPIYETKFHLAINDSKNAVKQFSVSQSDDTLCLEQTLDHLDGFLQAATELGDAWAKGDISRFEAAQNQKFAMTACWARLTNDAIARQQGITDLSARIHTEWLDELHRALREHSTIFATLPIRDLLDPKGIMTVLQSEGFQLTASRPVDIAHDMAK